MIGSGRFSASLIFPGDGPPIEQGVLAVDDGIITDVFAGPDTGATPLGNVILLPGLVNAHTHLEFSTCTTPLPAENGMAAWIGDVVATRLLQADRGDSIRHGLDELVTAGTAAVGEIATADWPASRLTDTDPACVVFREIIGLRSDRRTDGLATARDFLAGDSTPRHLLGLSPHAPYSVHPDLFMDLVRMAATHDVPLATPLAASPDELELLDTGGGPMRERLEALGAWENSAIPHGSRPLDYLRPLSELSHPLVIHGNLLGEEELIWLGRHRHVTIVYCPRTHSHFGHPPHPWARLLDSGTPVALGTDGRASNPDLSLWNELQFLARRTPSRPAKDMLAMATLTAATALGLERRLGTLSPGKEATSLGIALPADTPVTLEAILKSGHPAGVLRQGNWYPA